MTNRINPGTPPSQRPNRGQRPTVSTDPIDRAAKVSRALKEMLRQQGIIGPSGDRGAFYDLVPIYQAARSDPGVTDKNVPTPLEFTVDHDHQVSALEDRDPAKCLVDRHAAFAYVQHVDERVMEATCEQMNLIQQKRIQADPIAAGVDSCRGGPYGLMVTALAATRTTGQSPEDYFAAVLERAREQAASMDPIAAESLVDRVRKAIDECPDLRKVAAEGFDPDAD